MSILTVGVIAVGSATLGFLAAALLAAAKQQDELRRREQQRETHIFSGPSQN